MQNTTYVFDICENTAYLFVAYNDEDQEVILFFSHFSCTKILFVIVCHIGMNYIHLGAYKTSQGSPCYHVSEHFGEVFQCIVLQNICTVLKYNFCYFLKFYSVDWNKMWTISYLIMCLTLGCPMRYIGLPTPRKIRAWYAILWGFK